MQFGEQLCRTQTKLCSGRLRTPLFFTLLGYIQGSCLAGLLALILGCVVPTSRLAASYLWLLGTKFAHTHRSCRVLDDTLAPVIFLPNHRSWGDFWVDAALLGGPSFLARWLVAAAVPCTAAFGHFAGWIWFFNRAKKHEEGSTRWLQHFMRYRHRDYPGKGVLFYPEGTRSLLPKGLPLKPGGLATAFNLGWPVQIVITTNKEHVMAERSLSVGVGTRCVTSVSAPLFPKHFTSAKDFIKAVMSRWQETWEDAYGSAGLPRKQALLPGAVRSFSGLSLCGPFRLQVLRALCVLLAIYVARRFRSQSRRDTAEPASEKQRQS
eukprot:TRINITY_DN23160_c1_g1_i1.p1 TRINITY_DN23160_c1_g1~~TRINITY_DN23160_c1_g1_i1.p1  ORF type:complete len:322 (-),score=33.13 TRINITY_DN23160_c1_g1_i1:222-1187(-)